MVARIVAILASALSFAFLAGCTHTAYPITSGSHGSLPPRCEEKPRRVVVWGNNPIVVSTTMELFQRSKCIVIERAQLHAVLKEQQIKLTHTPDDEGDLLRVGKLLGADEIVFTEASTNSAISSQMFVNQYGGAGRSDTIYHLSVAARVVNVETGEIYATGSARYNTAVNNPDSGLVYLTQSALARAYCRIENGHTWSDKIGCSKSE